MKKVIHHGDAGSGALKCGAKPVGKYPADFGSNWAWRYEEVTCKKCLAVHKKEAQP